MYTPSSFRIEDLPTIHAFMQAHSFATLVTGGEALIATHLPVTLIPSIGELGAIHAHLARANPQWKQLEGGEILMMFQGAHTYISPTWYETHPSVPTWNYTAVHAYGTIRLVHAAADVEAMLRALVHQYENARTPAWQMDLPQDYMDRQIAAIVAFEMTITRLEAKYKLSQNRSDNDQASVIAHLSVSDFSDDLATARLMAEYLKPQASSI